MIKLVNQLAGMVLIGAIAAGATFAKEIRKAVDFSQPVVINGTVVKKGAYEVVFDDQTNELSIVKNGKVIARAPAQLEKRQERDHADYLTREDANSNAVLLSVVFKGNNQATIVNSGDSAQ